MARHWKLEPKWVHAPSFPPLSLKVQMLQQAKRKLGFSQHFPYAPLRPENLHLDHKCFKMHGLVQPVYSVLQTQESTSYENHEWPSLCLWTCDDVTFH